MSPTNGEPSAPCQRDDLLQRRDAVGEFELGDLRVEVGYGKHLFVGRSPFDIGAAVGEAVDLVGAARHRSDSRPMRVGL